MHQSDWDEASDQPSHDRLIGVAARQLQHDTANADSHTRRNLEQLEADGVHLGASQFGFPQAHASEMFDQDTGGRNEKKTELVGRRRTEARDPDKMIHNTETMLA